jgi:hypothetical protein
MILRTIMYGYTLATETTSGSLVFGFTQLLGDYSGIRDNPFTTGGVALWTDMRIDVCFGVRCGHGEDAFYASFF